LLYRESSQGQRGATEEFRARGSGDFDAEVADVLDFPKKVVCLGSRFCS
jgi:hypothetical protein